MAAKWFTTHHLHYVVLQWRYVVKYIRIFMNDDDFFQRILDTTADQLLAEDEP